MCRAIPALTAADGQGPAEAGRATASAPSVLGIANPICHPTNRASACLKVDPCIRSPRLPMISRSKCARALPLVRQDARDDRRGMLHGAVSMDAFKELEGRLRCSDCGVRSVSLEPVWHKDWVV